MRTSEAFVSVCILTVGLCAPAYSFDGTAGDNSVAPAVSVDIVGRGAVTSAPMNVPAPALASPSQSLAIPNPVIAAPSRPRSFDASRKPTAMEAFRAGTQSLRAGDVKGGISALEYAAENGHPVAQWKLGRIYADGDGVARDDLRAFEYFREIADAHADDMPGTAQSRFVANAFVALGQYYLKGIPGALKPNAVRAREMFEYAASYFGDADAQFNLGRIYADGVGVAKDGRLAARWLGLAANKGQHQAQALLGGMLFKGDVIPRQAARGLMLLTLASDSAQQQETWIRDLHDSAFKQATDDERQMALMYLERQLKGGRQ
jgi:TPR repeat protein